MNPTHYQVRNWSQYQQYRDRHPAWIKLHSCILASEDWSMLSDQQKAHLVAIMLVASRDKGKIPNNPAYIKRAAYLDIEPDLGKFVEIGFLDASVQDDTECKQTETNGITSLSPSLSPSQDKFINELPEKLNNEQFIDAWKKWREYCKGKGYPIQPMQEILTFTKLAEYRIEQAVEIVLGTIRGGWKGLVYDLAKKVESPPYYPTGEEIMARALKEQKERDDAKRAAQRCGIRTDAGQPGDAKPGGVRGSVRDSLA